MELYATLPSCCPLKPTLLKCVPLSVTGSTNLKAKKQRLSSQVSLIIGGSAIVEPPLTSTASQVLDCLFPAATSVHHYFLRGLAHLSLPRLPQLMHQDHDYTILRSACNKASSIVTVNDYCRSLASLSVEGTISITFGPFTLRGTPVQARHIWVHPLL